MKRGISLIVLSITILVMAILAATAMIALEDSGIIGRSKNTMKNNNYAEEYTRLTVIKNGILTDNLGTITLEEYITELTNKGIIETTRTDNVDGSVTVTTKSGFEVVLSQNGTSDLNIAIESNDNNGGTNSNQPSSKVSIEFDDGGMTEIRSIEQNRDITWGELIQQGFVIKLYSPIGNEYAYGLADNAGYVTTTLRGALSTATNIVKVKTTDKFGDYKKYYISGKELYGCNDDTLQNTSYTLTATRNNAGNSIYTSNANNQYVVTAQPKNGYYFYGWTISGEYEIISGDVNTSPITIKIKSDVTITPMFDKDV